jgi:hypothetical protein
MYHLKFVIPVIIFNLLPLLIQCVNLTDQYFRSFKKKIDHFPKYGVLILRDVQTATSQPRDGMRKQLELRQFSSPMTEQSH